MVGKRIDFDEKLDRMIKGPEEIKKIKKAAEIGDSCIPVVKEKLEEEGTTEKELAKAVDKKIKKKGNLSFRTVVVCGKRARYIHGKPTIKRIRGLGYVDLGAEYKGYYSDITVPFFKGEIGKKSGRILKDTMEIYDKVVDSIKLGEPCWKLHEKYEKFLLDRGYKVKHSLGHGLGKEVHEFPVITKPRSEKKMGPRKKKSWQRIKQLKFEPGMVFTIEPGIYVKGVGGCRIENDFLMGEKGPKVLTHARLIRVNGD